MKSYTIQPDNHYGIYVGRDKTNRQIFAGTTSKLLIIVVFDENGDFLEAIEKPHNFGQFAAKTETALLQWLTEIGFSMQAISVKKFFLNQYSIGIQDFPDELEHFQYEPTDDDSTEYQEYIDWQARGDFVLWWSRDFWCNEDGYITTS
jgi:hypothetical protein